MKPIHRNNQNVKSSRILNYQFLQFSFHIIPKDVNYVPICTIFIFIVIVKIVIFHFDIQITEFVGISEYAMMQGLIIEVSFQRLFSIYFKCKKYRKINIIQKILCI